MNPALELAQLLLGDQPVAENMQVLSCTPTSIRLSSRSGTIDLKNDGTVYHPGASVMVKDSVVLGRTRRESQVPVYYL